MFTSLYVTPELRQEDCESQTTFGSIERPKKQRQTKISFHPCKPHMTMKKLEQGRDRLKAGGWPNKAESSAKAWEEAERRTSTGVRVEA